MKEIEGNRNNIRFPRVGTWLGRIGGILGICAAGFVVYDRYFPPSLEVHGVRPVYIHGERIMNFGDGEIVIPEEVLGSSFIFKVQVDL